MQTEDVAKNRALQLLVFFVGSLEPLAFAGVPRVTSSH